MLPYPNKAKLDVTMKMKEQNYDQVRMYKLAEQFFVSLGKTYSNNNKYIYLTIVGVYDVQCTCAYMGSSLIRTIF